MPRALLVASLVSQLVKTLPYLVLVCFRERAMLAKNNRKLEKKCKEAMLQVEEERRHADQYKEQVCSHYRQLSHVRFCVALLSYVIS